MGPLFKFHFWELIFRMANSNILVKLLNFFFKKKRQEKAKSFTKLPSQGFIRFHNRRVQSETKWTTFLRNFGRWE